MQRMDCKACDRGRWQLQSGLVVAGQRLSSCWDCWEVPVACAEEGWRSHLVHPNNFTFLEREMQLTLAAQIFVNWVNIVRTSAECRRKAGHWDITKFKKNQIKEDLLRLSFTHTFSKCLRDFTHVC